MHRDIVDLEFSPPRWYALTIPVSKLQRAVRKRKVDEVILLDADHTCTMTSSPSLLRFDALVTALRLYKLWVNHRIDILNAGPYTDVCQEIVRVRKAFRPTSPEEDTLASL